MSKKSKTLSEKLDGLIAKEPTIRDFEALYKQTQMEDSFQSPEDLEGYLMEGVLLNINKIGSKALSVPCGEYIVMAHDNGNTMLIPYNVEKENNEVLEAVKDEYELFTSDIVRNYNSMSRAICEKETDYEAEHEGNVHDNRGDNVKDNEQGFQSKIDMDSVQRTPIARAMEQHGFTVSSLAAACNVDPPAISRILRTPKERAGDPGGRNPSIGLAAQISDLLKMSPEALFPDIFHTRDRDIEARDQKGNRGSGMKGAAKGSARKGKATQKWTQGAAGQE